MNRCPICHCIYSDSTFKFCRNDGAPLVSGSFPSEDPTAKLMDSAQQTGDFDATKLLRSNMASTEAAPLSDMAGRVRRKRQSRKAIESLAVLPLVNANADPNAEYLSDGITESIINSLSRLPKLRVMARSSVFRYKGQEVDPQEVGHALQVRAVLTGRVVHLGARLIINMEMVDVADGTQLWGQQYNRTISDIFEVQEEISSEISEKLRLRLSGDQKKRITKRYTGSTEAYHLYMKGRYFWNKRTEDALKKSIEYFNQAIGKDKKFALAYAGIANSYNILSYYSYFPPNEIWPKAKAAAVKAIELDDTLAEAHAALAFVILHHDWDWPAAKRECEQAIKLNPNDSIAYHWYSHYWMAMGMITKSLAESERALRIDPLDIALNAHLGWHYLLARQYDNAIEELRNTIEMETNWINVHFWLGEAYLQKGRYEEALAELQKADDLAEGNPRIKADLGRAYAMWGKRNEAQKILNNLIDLSQRQYVSPYFIAEVYMGLGDNDQAFQWLDSAYEERSNWLVYLKTEPKFDGLRSDPRFIDLLQRLNLT